jgi:hypothetical protein
MQYESAPSWSVTGRGLDEFGVGAVQTPSPTASAGLDISPAFNVTAVWGRGVRSLRNILFGWNEENGGV